MSEFVKVYTRGHIELKVRISDIVSVIRADCEDCEDVHCFLVTMKNGAEYWTSQETYDSL